MIQNDISPQVQEYWHKRNSVAGWMCDIDFLLFDEILRSQRNNNVKGNLLEIGAYLGKSAIVMGSHAQVDEKFIICDVFTDPIRDDNSNEDENRASYNGLTRMSFEANYRRFLSNEITIVQELSEEICAHVEDESVRFAHIDGGHLYITVKQDIANATRYMKHDGLVAFDDFRSFHTPGVAAAIWEEIAASGLLPVCVSESKLYATWSAVTALSTTERLLTWLAPHPEVHYGTQMIAGQKVIIVANPKIQTLRGRIKTFIPPVIMDIVQPKGQNLTYLGDR